MRSRQFRHHHHPLVSRSGTAARSVSRPHVEQALLAVEGRLRSIYTRQAPADDDRRFAVILAACDAKSPVWLEVLQMTYLENAREGLLSTLRALPQPHGRPY